MTTKSRCFLFCANTCSANLIYVWVFSVCPLRFFLSEPYDVIYSCGPQSCCAHGNAGNIRPLSLAISWICGNFHILLHATDIFPQSHWIQHQTPRCGAVWFCWQRRSQSPDEEPWKSFQHLIGRFNLIETELSSVLNLKYCHSFVWPVTFDLFRLYTYLN